MEQSWGRIEHRRLCYNESVDKHDHTPATVTRSYYTDMKRYLSLVSSVVMVTSYLLFALLSLSKFPTPYSPTSNWLSDLGSNDLNPRGAIFYNVGIVMTGISILPFFLGLSSWAMAGNKKQKAMLFLTQLFGVLGALAVVMSALFPINIEGTHTFWSAALYILIGTAIAFSVAALRYHSEYPRWLLFLGILVTLEDMLWSMVLNTYIFEWLTVTLFLTYILLLGLETRRKAIHIEGTPTQGGAGL